MSSGNLKAACTTSEMPAQEFWQWFGAQSFDSESGSAAICNVAPVRFASSSVKSKIERAGRVEFDINASFLEQRVCERGIHVAALAAK